MQIKIRGNDFLLLPQKAIFRNNLRQLILADVHLGKATHFRKAGFNMPAGGADEDIRLINGLIKNLQPLTVMLLGDLFHSEFNREWSLVEKLLKSNPDIKFVLIKGNHDILKFQEFDYSNLEILPEYNDNDFVYSHKPVKSEKFVICGHIHPGVNIQDGVFQTFRLPCFYLSDDQLVLPAFGKLTGLQTIRKINNTDKFYVIYNSRISIM